MAMSKATGGDIGRALEQLARRATTWTGTSWAFASAVGVIIIWALTGPFFRFADTWQLVINTGTTIVTFIMVFLIQRSQNKDAQAVHLKLNELVAALEGASSRLINVEDLTEDEVRTLHRHYQGLVILAKRESTLTHSHSIEEAEVRHRRKARRGPASLAVTPRASHEPPARVSADAAKAAAPPGGTP
jgi:low affinity Fe/Cu permease